MSLRIIFAGTPDFALPTMQALLQSEHQIIAVLTQPDRPAGRGRQLTASPVKQLATQYQLPVYQPLGLKDQAIQDTLRELAPEVMVVIAYGLLLPPTVLAIPRFGCINVHASLLPKWRGAAPIQRAILAGDNETGITIMQIEAGLDTGPMLTKVTCPIGSGETSLQLHDQLAKLGASALLDTLVKVENNTLRPIIQDDARASHAAKITKAEAEINWQHTAVAIHNQIRAFNPWPIALTHFNQQPLRIWQASVAERQTDQAPGMLIHLDAMGLYVATGHGVLRLEHLQLPGKRVLPARDFINAYQAKLQCNQLQFN